jgi:hypothetical protein
LLRDGDAIGASNDLSLARARHLIYIDDLVILAKTYASALLLQDSYMQAMERIGFVIKRSKTIRPTLSPVDIVGVELHGQDLTFGVSPRKLRRLQVEIALVVAAGCVTGRALQRLLGKLTWSMLVRRSALSVFNAVYRFAETAGNALFDLWPSVRQELVVASGLLPLLSLSLRAAWTPDIVASDASSYAQGVVITRLPCHVVSQLAVVHGKRSVVSANHLNEGRMPLGRSGAIFPVFDGSTSARGCAASHLPALKSSCPVSVFSNPTVAQQQHLSAVVSSVCWTRVVSSKFRYSSHINALELQAIRTAVHWALSSPRSIGTRLLLLSDSAVVVGAVSKGRSPSFCLRRSLRSLAAVTLASQLCPVLRWLPTQLNPADYASRFPGR